jgi:hypothetical protein
VKHFFEICNRRNIFAQEHSSTKAWHSFVIKIALSQGNGQGPLNDVLFAEKETMVTSAQASVSCCVFCLHNLSQNGNHVSLQMQYVAPF